MAFLGLVMASLAAVLISGNVAFQLVVEGHQTYQAITKPPIQEVKALYLTAYTAGLPKRRAELIELIKTTELNAVIIDLKDSTGGVFFDSQVPLARQTKAVDIRIPDLADWIAQLKQDRIYTIARIVVFQDPWLAGQRSEISLKNKSGEVWRDFKGLSWVDPTKKEVWQYNLDLAKEAVRLGFDEINFDYIRFPSDGNIKQIDFESGLQGRAKHEVMADFYAFVEDEFRGEPARTSADLFGMTLWRSDGLNIGQRLEDAAKHFDYVMPMVYPSHYPDGFEGFANPAEYPYDIIFRSLIRAPEFAKGGKAKIRPWLQDFDLGAEYTPERIHAQIKATNQAKGLGWALWNASNRYTVDAFKVATR